MPVRKARTEVSRAECRPGDAEPAAASWPASGHIPPPALTPPPHTLPPLALLNSSRLLRGPLISSYPRPTILPPPLPS